MCGVGEERVSTMHSLSFGRGAVSESAVSAKSIFGFAYVASRGCEQTTFMTPWIFGADFLEKVRSAILV